MYKKIDSTQNSLIKQCLVLLEKSRERRKQGLFLVEGQREIQLSISGGYELQTLLFCEEICSENSTKYTTKNTQIIEISLEVYQKLAYRKTTEGILAIVKTKELALNKLHFKNKNPLILIAEAPENPEILALYCVVQMQQILMVLSLQIQKQTSITQILLEVVLDVCLPTTLQREALKKLLIS